MERIRFSEMHREGHLTTSLFFISDPDGSKLIQIHLIYDHQTGAHVTNHGWKINNMSPVYISYIVESIISLKPVGKYHALASFFMFFQLLSEGITSLLTVK